MFRLPARRLFHTCQPARAIRRLPSLAEIKSIDIEHYVEESAESRKVRELEDEARRKSAVSEPAPSLIKAFLYGSPSKHAEEEAYEQSFSKALARGKYVHELMIHKVHPGAAPDYLELVSDMYPQIAADSSIGSRLVGSWRTVIGDMDAYVHIWEYEGYNGFHHAMNKMHEKPKYLEFLDKLRPTLRSRRSELMQEFSFWGGTAPPHDMGGVFEMRSYVLKSGQLAEWEHSWRKGIEMRRKVMEPVGAWFSQLGELNRVHYIWQFADLEHRKVSREKCWEMPEWAETVHETVPLIERMEANILVALPFSPLK